jgi:SAM-dependent methyltransferase
MSRQYNILDAFLFGFFVSPRPGEAAAFQGNGGLRHGEGARILDVGCGGGQLAIEIAKAGRTLKVTGVDLCRSQIRRAGRRSLAAGVDLELVRASALELPFPDETFDMVYSVDCKKLWPDRENGLGACTGSLRPGEVLPHEVSRDCTLKQGFLFIRGWRLPLPLRPLSIIPLFMFAVLRSITVDEARSMASRLDLKDAVVIPHYAGINWAMSGTRA